MKFNRSNPFRRITTFRICLIKRKFQFVQCSCIAKILTFEIKIRIQVISCVNVSLYSSCDGFRYYTFLFIFHNLVYHFYIVKTIELCRFSHLITTLESFLARSRSEASK